MSPYNTAGLISEASEEVATQIAKNCNVQDVNLFLQLQELVMLTDIGVLTMWLLIARAADRHTEHDDDEEDADDDAAKRDAQ